MKIHIEENEYRKLMAAQGMMILLGYHYDEVSKEWLGYENTVYDIKDDYITPTQACDTKDCTEAKYWDNKYIEQFK